MLGNQERDYRDIMDLQKLLGGMGAQKEALSLDEKMKDVPMKDAERAHKTLGFQIDTEQMPAMKGYALNEGFRKDRLAQSTFPTDIENNEIAGQAKVEGSKAGLFESRLQHVANLAGMADGPMGLAQVMEQAEAYGIKPGSKLHDQLSSRTTPEDMKKYLIGLQEHLNTAKAKELRGIESREQQKTQELKMRAFIADLNARSRERVGGAHDAANERIAQTRASAIKNNQNAVKYSLEQDYTRMKEQHGPDSPQAKQSLAVLVQSKAAKSAADWAAIFARTEYNKEVEEAKKNKDPSKQVVPHTRMMELLTQGLKAFGVNVDVPLDETGGGAERQQSPGNIDNGIAPPPGALRNESSLRDQMGGLPKSYTEEELSSMYKEFKRMPDGKPKLEMGLAIQEGLKQLNLSKALSGPLPGMGTPAPTTTTPAGVPGITPGAFKRWQDIQADRARSRSRGAEK
jgi:hypothetical protein